MAVVITPVHISAAIDEESWEYLQESEPLFADAVKRDVRAGCSPDDIFWQVLAQVGSGRRATALRCKQAAQHLWSQRTTGEGVADG